MVTVGDLSLSRWLTIPLALAWCAVAWRSPMRKAQTPHLLMGLFVLWAVITTIVTLDLDRSWRRIISYCQLFAQAWVVFQFTRSKKDWHRILQAYVIGSWLPLLGVFYNWRQGYILGDGRYTAFGFDPNDLAGTLALAVPIVWYQMTRYNRWRWWNKLFLVMVVLAILLTASRGGLVSLGMASIYPLWTMRKISWSQRLAMLALLLISGVTVFHFRDAISFHRLATIGPQFATRDLNGRYQVWIRGAEVLMENPLLGVGPGAFGTALGIGGGAKVHAHNTMLEVAVEHGVIGFVLFVSIIVSLFWPLCSLAPAERALLITVLAIWLVASSALSWENREITWLVWALCGTCRRSWSHEPPSLAFDARGASRQKPVHLVR
jgi:O-antigen ligase